MLTMRTLMHKLGHKGLRLLLVEFAFHVTACIVAGTGLSTKVNIRSSEAPRWLKSQDTSD